MTKAVFGEETAEDHRISSSVYFAIAVAVLLICASAHYAIQKNKRKFQMAFFQAEYAASTDSFMLRSDAIKRSIQAELGAELEEEGRAAQAADAGGDECPNEEEKEEDRNDVEVDALGETVGENFNFDDREEQENEGESGKGKMHHIFSLCSEGTKVYRAAFRCAWLPIVAQFVNFFITLSLFPGVGK